MPDILFLIFTFFSEALIVFSYANSIYKTKKNGYLSFSIVVLLYMIFMLTYRYVINLEFLNLLSVLIINILIIKFVFISSVKSAVFQGVVLGIVQYVSEFVGLYITAFSIGSNVSSANIVTDNYEIITVISRILYFLITRLLIQFSVKEIKAKSWGRWFSLALLPISSMFIILVIRNITSDIELRFYQNLLCILSIFFLLIVNIVVYMIYERAEKSSQKLIELEITNQKNNIDMQYLNLLEKKNEQMQIMAHDYKNHMLVIESMSNSVDINEYINNILGEIKEYNKICKSNNKLLDVILSKYVDICDEKGINFNINILSENLSEINNVDISSLFNNLLDNAVEAAECSDNKFIELEIANSLNSYRRITVINSCIKKPNSKEEKLLTTKRNKDAHGFGTKSIRKIVEKYNGETQWEYDEAEKIFKTVILIPIIQ